MPSRGGGARPALSAFLLFCLVLLPSVPLAPDASAARTGSGSGAQEPARSVNDTLPPLQPWPMFRGGPSRTGQSAVDTAENPGEGLWKLKLGGIIYSSPAIGADGTIYIGCGDHYIYAVKPGGALAWKLLTGSDIDGSPAIGPDGNIYFGSDKFYAVRPDGTRIWSYPLLYGTSSSPVVAPNGTVYIGTLEGTLYALDQYGRLLGSFNASGPIDSSPALDPDGNIYFGSKDGCVYSIAPDMLQRWMYQTGDDVGATPCVGPDRTVYIGSKDGNIYAITETGELKWKHYLGRQVFSSVAQGPDGTLYVGCGDFRICALNPGGTLQWDYPTGGMVDSSPAVGADGTVYVGSQDGFLYALHPDGMLKWKYRTEKELFGSPAIASNGSVVFGGWDKHVHCVGARFTRPTAPRELGARLAGTAVELAWRAPAYDGGKPLNAYRIFRSKSGTDFALVGAVSGGQTAFTDRNLTGPGVYYYRVTALNPVGESPPSEPVNLTVRLRPMPPRNLRATAGDGSVRLDWDPPGSDGGAEVSAYRIYWTGNDPDGSLLVEVPASVRKFDQVNLQNYFQYLFEATAVNGIGESDPSDSASATPRPLPPGLPSPPRDVSTMSWDRAVDVAWLEPESDGGRPLTGYLIFRETVPGMPELVANLSAGDRTYRDMDVTNGHTYMYYMKARNDAGESELSDGAMARPLGSLADRTPPDIRIIRPENGSLVHVRPILVAGQAGDISGIALVEVCREGREWSRARGTGEWAQNITLSPGKNTILVRATDGWNNTAYASVTVSYEPEPVTKVEYDFPLIVALLVLIAVMIFALVSTRKWRGRLE